MDAIVIEDIVAQSKLRLIDWATNAVWVEALAMAPWLGYVSWLFRPAIKWVIKTLVNQTELGLFIINSKLLTGAQGNEYIKDAIAVRDLPEDISDEQWIAAEEKANKSFDNLMRYTA